MPKKTAVIGIGNTLRRDDGIGIIILESLLKFYKKEGVEYLNFGTASFDLIHKISDYKTVLLIDAINASLPAGEVRFFELKEVEYNVKELPISTHELNLTGLFDLSKTFKVKTKIHVAGIQVEDLSWNEGLSDSLEKRKDNIIKQISAYIDKFFRWKKVRKKRK